MDRTEFAEIAVGAALLGLRRVNIARRDLVDKMPETEPLVDWALERIETNAEPASAKVAEILCCVGQAVGGDAGQQMRQIAPAVEQLGPKLLHMSGLTSR